MELVLSLFTGGGLLDMGFRAEGFCVVSAGDILTGHDVRDFRPAGHKFDGVIGGPPCQDFSKARQGVPVRPYACDVATRAEYGYGVAMLREFERCVRDAAPNWFLCENVPGVPDVTVPGFAVQRITINVTELGHNQDRWRCIQFGSRDGVKLVIPRTVTCDAAVSPTLIASRITMSFRAAARLQGLPENYSLHGFTDSAKQRLLGNGVPLPLGRALAAAVREREARRWMRACVCGCARPVRRGVTLATDACRQRVSREDRSLVTPRCVTLDLPLEVTSPA